MFIQHLFSQRKKLTLEKTLSTVLDNYQGSFAILSKYIKSINWFNKNKPDYIVGEVLTKKRNSSLTNFIANCCINTDFKSININYYDIYKIKKIKEDSLVLGYLIDNQEKYLVYKDIFDNLFIDNVYELQMTEEIL